MAARELRRTNLAEPYHKTRNEFTEDNMGKGPSKGMHWHEGEAGTGQRILMAYPMDNVTYDLPDEHGGHCHGGPTNIAHSLKGASVVDDGPGAVGPVKHIRIKDH
jgi:hypothetical protein